MSHERDPEQTRRLDPAEGDEDGLLDTVRQVAPPEVSRTIGRYRLLQLVGSGGMGEVWEAEQEEPVRRKVALKLIKLGMDTREFTARFEVERQALALMDHQNIARVFDGGATERGRPYLVMEYVRGIPITDYCDRHHLSTRDRLELFMEVCNGVQHAHQKGIIHRDLKPSNVLVAVSEDRPLPKIIDFGVAKATAQPLTDATYVTRLGEWIGTPAYMSPEQAEPGNRDIDTRTDIYSLGVILYQLLTGSLPLALEQLSDEGPESLHRRIREIEPQKPSARVQSLSETRESSDRGTDRLRSGSSARAELRGDLDWITMKALRKERHERYATASELAADVRRHIEGVPVTARAPTFGYRARKFVTRNRLPVAAAALSAVLLLGFSWAMKVQADRAAREARTAEEISDFLVELFEVSDPLGVPELRSGYGNKLTARQVLERGAHRVRTGLDREPLTRARLSQTLGRVFLNIGDYEQAEAHLLETVQLRREQLGEDHPDYAAALDTLAGLYLTTGDPERARDLFESSLEIQQAAQRTDDPALAGPLLGLGSALSTLGDYEAAQPLLERALRLRETDPDTEAQEIADVLEQLGVLHRRWGNYDLEADYLERAMGIDREVYGDQHPEFAASALSFAQTLRDHDLERATAVAERAVAVQERTLDPDHPALAFGYQVLADCRDTSGDYERATELYRRSIAILEQDLQPRHPDLLSSLMMLGDSLMAQGQYREAEQTLRRVLAQQEDSPQLPWTLTTLGLLQGESGQLGEGRATLERALGIRERDLGAEHPETAISLDTVAWVAQLQGDYAAAREHYERSLAVKREALGEDHLWISYTLATYGLLLADLGELEAAEKECTTARDILTETLGPDSEILRDALLCLGKVRHAQGRDDEARRLFESGVAVTRNAHPAPHPAVADAESYLAVFLMEIGDLEGARALLEHAREIYDSFFDPRHPSIARSLGHFADLASAQGDMARARSLYRQALEIQDDRLRPEQIDRAHTYDRWLAVNQERPRP